VNRSARRPEVTEEALASWCDQHLGSPISDLLFESGYLSAVLGVRLRDHREVVVKVRLPEDRIVACLKVQRHLWEHAFPCPEPLTAPLPLGRFSATAERLVRGGRPLAPSRDRPRRFAEALARLISLTPAPESLPSLHPTPAWVWWDHPYPGTWPPPDDRDDDLNAYPPVNWIDDAAQRARRRLERSPRTPIVGHADWYSLNVLWEDERLHVVHDWDSIARRPEVVLAGCAAAVFSADGGPNAATVEETDQFLEAYQAARGRAWTADDRELCWAAGLWTRAFDAKKASLNPGAEPLVEQLESELDERLIRAGA
jgi:Ser/Thr protein kinase RdoA (MazF antagonist)